MAIAAIFPLFNSATPNDSPLTLQASRFPTNTLFKKAAPLSTFCTTATPGKTRTDGSPTANLSPRYPKRKRGEVRYTEVDEDVDASTDSEAECEPHKRVRLSTKPLPQKKIFPFLSLPGEIRNKIYSECLPKPTRVVKSDKSGEPALYFAYRQLFYRRTIDYLPDFPDDMDRIEYTARFNSRNADSDSENDDDQEPETQPLAFNILAICKQIYDEAAPLVYSKKLVFLSPEALFAFATRLSPRTAKLIRHIELLSWAQSRSRKLAGYNAIAMLAAKGVTNLETLHLNCEIGWFRAYHWRHNPREMPVPKRIARQVYRHCHLWLEAVAAVTGQWDKGVEVLKIGEPNFGDWIGRCYHDKGVLTEDEIFEVGLKVYQKELRRLVGLGVW